MPRIIIEATHINPDVCFECGAPATERHHVVPASLGGTKTIPLCGECHAKVHDVSGRRRNKLRDLTKNSLEKRKEQLAKDGFFVSKSGNVRTHFGREKGADLSAANAASVESKKLAAKEWREKSVGYQWVKRQLQEGKSRKEIIEEFNEKRDARVEGFCTAKGGPLTKATLSLWASEIENEGIERGVTDVTALNANIESFTEKQSSLTKCSRPSVEEKKRRKQEWLQNSEASKYVRNLFGSYKTRYLLAGEKIKLFNQRYELIDGNKIANRAQWAVLAKDLGFSGIPTGGYEMTEFLYEWAIKSSKDLVEARIVERIRYNEVEGYVIYPTSVQIDLLELHTWWSFLDGLTLDGIITKSSNDGELPTYRFVSREVVDKILKDLAE